MSVNAQSIKDQRLAVLIDAENVPRNCIKNIMEEAAIYGTPTIKRIYGDWTSPAIAGWKNPLLKNAITPIQQYSYTTGKNSSDSAMIIDAMDILYSEKTDGFVIVSSDSDFTRLAIRLREAGQRVIGIGEKKTPNAFIAACDKFIYIEVIRAGGSQQDESPAEHESDETQPGRDETGGKTQPEQSGARIDREAAGGKSLPGQGDNGADREAAGGKVSSEQDSARQGQENSQKASQQQRDKARRQARARGVKDNAGGDGASSIMEAAAGAGAATAHLDAAGAAAAAAHLDAAGAAAAAHAKADVQPNASAQADTATHADASANIDATHQARARSEKIPSDIVRLIADSVSDLAGDDGVVFMGELGNLIQKKKPDFDHRNYGYKSLSAMIKSIDRFEIDFRQTADPNIKHVFVRDKMS